VGGQRPEVPERRSRPGERAGEPRCFRRWTCCLGPPSWQRCCVRHTVTLQHSPQLRSRRRAPWSTCCRERWTRLTERLPSSRTQFYGCRLRLCWSRPSGFGAAAFSPSSWPGSIWCWSGASAHRPGFCCSCCPTRLLSRCVAGVGCRSTTRSLSSLKSSTLELRTRPRWATLCRPSTGRCAWTTWTDIDRILLDGVAALPALPAAASARRPSRRAGVSRDLRAVVALVWESERRRPRAEARGLAECC
jgi:hypothetical protein